MGLSPEELEVRRAELADRRRHKQELQRRRMVLVGLIILFGLLLAAVSAFWTYQRGIGPLAWFGYTAASERVNVLFLGTDTQGFNGGRTDTVMLVSFAPRSGDVGIISIPRDTRVQLPGRNGYDRVNTAHAFGGPRLAMEAVEGLLGIPIHHYVKLDFEGFESVIDTLGGVEMDVTIPMRYDDYAQDLHIDLQPGHQRLNGEQALHYVRYRGGLGDISLIDPSQDLYDGRVTRQLQFVQAVLQQALHPTMLTKVPDLMRQVDGLLETDVPMDKMVSLSLAARRVDLDRVEVALVPGVGETIGGASYWVVDKGKIEQVVQRLIHGRDRRI